jgi:uncharacterized protein (TIGR02147 family)
MKKSKFKTSREILQFDYEVKKKKNSRFSMRSYAKMLGISSGRLSEILSGKSPLTEKKARSIIDKLSLDTQDKQYFLRLVENEYHFRSQTRGQTKTTTTTRKLNIEEFSVICDWEYFSLMALIETSTFKSESKWIAKKLGISVTRTQEVLGRLQKLGFISREDGEYKNTHRSLSTLTDIPSSALRKANTECIQHGLEKMNTIDVHLRDITSITLPVNIKKIKEAKMLIRKFKAQMSRLLAKDETTEIYNLNIQLVPVSQLGI